MLTLELPDPADCDDLRLARAIAVWLCGYGWAVTLHDTDDEGPRETTWAPQDGGTARLTIRLVEGQSGNGLGDNGDHLE